MAWKHVSPILVLCLPPGGLGQAASPLWASASHLSNGQAVMEEPVGFILGGTSWANPSFSPSSGFSAEQRVSPGSAHPSHQCYCHYDDGHRAFTKCQAPCSAWACAVHFASFLAQGVHAMVLPPSPFYRWGAELRACQRVAQGHTANWPRHT